MPYLFDIYGDSIQKKMIVFDCLISFIFFDAVMRAFIHQMSRPFVQ